MLTYTFHKNACEQGKAKAALAGGTIGIVTHVGDTLHHNDKKHNKHASAKKHRGDAYRLLDDDTSKRMRKQLAAVGCKLVVRHSSSASIAECLRLIAMREEGLLLIWRVYMMVICMTQEVEADGNCLFR
jgi:hypothetical protein